MTLGLLIESGAHLAVCTNKQQAATRAVLDGFEIAKYFDVILGGDVVRFENPIRAIFFRLSKNLTHRLMSR